MTLSLWLDENTEDSAVKTAIEVDLAIIGGGVVGAALAYQARQKQPGIKVCVIEADSIASGASGRGGGFVLRGIHTYYDSCVKQYGRDVARYIYGLGARNQVLMRQFKDDCQQDIDYDPCGSYLLASSLEELEELARACTLMNEDGFAVELLKRDPLDRGFYGALYNKDDFGINPVKLVRALLAASEATVLEENAVRKIEDMTICGSRRNVKAERIIIATNAYSSSVDSYFDGKLQPARGQMIATVPLKKKVVEALCYANYGWEYFRQLPDRRMVVGGCRQLFLAEEMVNEDAVSKPVQTALEHYFKDHFPELAGTAIDYRWSGTIAFTNDGLPLLGQLPAQPGVYFAVGCNGHGLGYSMALAEQLLKNIYDDEPCGPFAAEREGVRRVLTRARMTGEFEIGP
jgi:gamma-glutamylputrescine oxidase